MAEVERKDAAAPDDAGETLIRLAIGRLRTLDQLVAAEGGTLHNPERSALLGSAYKRLASVKSRAVLAARDAARREAAAKVMREALQHSIEAYGRDEGHPGTGHFDSYLVLNRLALQALLPWPAGSAAADKARAIDLARQCRGDAEARYAKQGSPWSAVMQSEAVLVEALLLGSLGRTDEPGQVAFDALAASYASTLVNLTLTPAQLDSVVTQMELLSRFCDALWRSGGDAALYRTADRLLELSRRIHPGKRPRNDRPAPPAAASAGKPRPARRSRARLRRRPRRRRSGPAGRSDERLSPVAPHHSHEAAHCHCHARRLEARQVRQASVRGPAPHRPGDLDRHPNLVNRTT